MSNRNDLHAMTKQNLEAAISHLRATTDVWASRKIYGDLSVRLKFTDGLAIQWEAAICEVHKTGVGAPVKTDK